MWDNLTYSSIFVVLAHTIFFYIVSRSDHVLGLFSSCLLIVVWLDVWKMKIWPEVRAETPSSDSEWGELHPRLLSITEMCELLADFVIFFQDSAASALTMRKNEPAKFVAYGCGCCLLTAAVGKLFSGFVLAYLTFFALMFWPMIWHHRLVEVAYTSMEPYLAGLKYTQKSHNGEGFETAISSNTARSSEVSTPDEDFISAFVPKMTDNTVDVLAKALSEDTELADADDSLLPSHSNLLKMDSLDKQAGSLVMPLPDDLSDNGSDDENLGFIPSNRNSVSEDPQQVQENPILTNEASHALNSIIREVSNSAVNNINKIVQQNLLSGLTQLVPQQPQQQNTSNQARIREVAPRRSDSSTPSSEFEVLDSSMLE